MKFRLVKINRYWVPQVCFNEHEVKMYEDYENRYKHKLRLKLKCNEFYSFRYSIYGYTEMFVNINVDIPHFFKFTAKRFCKKFEKMFYEFVGEKFEIVEI